MLCGVVEGGLIGKGGLIVREPSAR